MKKILFVALLVMSANSHAVTAHFTGNMESAQSVTYQIGYKCQYQYAGNFFWVFFMKSCPISIEIQ